ncbi:MAG: Eco57I restriction-modification methylase domain-containing protein [Promethearchaeota archaeon]
MPAFGEYMGIFAPSAIMKEFHTQYRRCATYLTQTFQGVNDSFIKEQIVQILLIRLVFVWLLQLTGCLNRDPQYLLTKFQARRGQTFYRGFLQLLFQGLATPRTQRTPQMHQLLGEVPYLGAGLFLPTAEEARFAESLDWPDAVFYQPLKYSVSSKIIDIPLLNLLKSYNWTLDEKSTDMNKINPKILGYVFEQSRHAKSLGVVYTPDSVSSQMCKAVLAQTITNEIQIKNISNNIATFRDLLTITDPELQKTILKKLKTLKILDPACGTGHFLLAMLFHLEQIYLAFHSNPSLTIKTRSSIREFIISNNLFGVDILPRAIEVTKLRLFLTLAEQYEGNQNIQPLTAIDLHLRNGNSVVGFYRQKEEYLYNFLDDQVRKSLDERLNLIKEYKLLARDGSTDIRMKIQNKTEDLQLIFSKKLLQVLKIQNMTVERFNKEITPFHWVMEFSDVLAQGGFDMVIGNPPYVRADSVDINLQQYRKFTEKLYDTLIEKWDLYIAFIELGLKLLKPQGILAYIISDAFCTAKYAKKSRNLLLKTGYLYQIDFFPNITLFQEVGVNSIILHYQKGQNTQNPPTKRVIHKTIDEIERIESLNSADVWELVFRQDINLDLLKLNTIKLKLGEICFISKGMVLNSDEKKYKNEFKKDDLISSLKDEIHSKEYVTGSFIRPYYLSEIKYLEWNTDRVPHKISRPTFPELYIYPKLLVSRIGCKAVCDEKGILVDDNVNIIVPRHYLRNIENRVLSRREERKLTRNFADRSTHFDLRFICAIINSELGRSYLNTIRQHRMKNYIYPNELKKLPIPDVSIEEQQIIVDLVIEVENLINVEGLSKTKKTIKELLNKVDSKIELIYSSYLRKVQEKNH